LSIIRSSLEVNQTILGMDRRTEYRPTDPQRDVTTAPAGTGSNYTYSGNVLAYTVSKKHATLVYFPSHLKHITTHTVSGHFPPDMFSRTCFPDISPALTIPLPFYIV